MSNGIKYRMVPITDVLDFVVDNRGKTVPTVESGFPLIATNCIKENSIFPTFENIRCIDEDTRKNWFRAELKSNDILFVNKGTPGRVCLVPDPVNFCAAQDMIGLRCNEEKIYYKYLFAVLRSKYIKEKIANYHVGIAIPHFKKSDLKELKIPLPPMNIQKSIGDTYYDISYKIFLNECKITELEQLSKELFEHWFLRFRFPNEENTPYAKNGGMKYNELLKREIPEEWKVIKLDDCVEEVIDHRGKTPKKWVVIGSMMG